MTFLVKQAFIKAWPDLFRKKDWSESSDLGLIGLFSLLGRMSMKEI